MAASVDSSELRAFAAELGAVPASLVPKIRGVVTKGAVNIKNQQRADFDPSTRFKQIAKTISFDVSESRGAIEAEIGPNRRYRAARLANIAYFEAESHSRAVFGTSTSGGVVPDPSVALEDEMPRFLDALGDVLGKALNR